MSIFLILMVMGLTGMVMMALPGLFRSAHIGGHHIGHAGHHVGGQHGAHGGQLAHGHGAQQGEQAAAGPAPRGIAGILPSPRTIFSLLAMYGAFGYALAEAAHLGALPAGLVALAPAWLLERYAVTPLWNALFQFQAAPCSPLEDLTFCEAEAVTPFANGRGIVRVVRDGRMVQFSARLPEEQASMPVRVGDKLKVEEVDTAHERLTVTLR
jgi:hypothetical protein